MIIDIRYNGKIRRLSDSAQAVPRVGDIVDDHMNGPLRVHGVIWSLDMREVLLMVLPVGTGREDPK